MLGKKNNIVWLLAFILVLQLFITFWVSLKNGSCKNELTKTTVDYQFILDKQRDISQREFLCFQAANNKLDTTILCTNIKGVKKTVSTLLQEEDNFVLILPESICTSCYEKLLNNLGSIKLNLFGNLQIICSKYNLMKVAVYCKNAPISEPHAVINRENIIGKIDLEKYNIPFILKVKKDGTIKSVYYMDNENIEYILSLNTR